MKSPRICRKAEGCGRKSLLFGSHSWLSMLVTAALQHGWRVPRAEATEMEPPENGGSPDLMQRKGTELGNLMAVSMNSCTARLHTEKEKPVMGRWMLNSHLQRK